MLIAVTSKDGKQIDQHFGHAERFLIFEVEEGDIRLVDEKLVDRYCSYDPENPLRRNVLQAIGQALQGCSALVTAQMGECPQQEMERLGIETFIAQGPIKETLLELAKVL